MRGLTLTELIIAMVISSIIMFTIGIFTVNIVRAEREVMKIHNTMSSTDIATEIFREYVTQAESIQIVSSSALRIDIENDSGMPEAYDFFYHHDGTTGELLYNRPDIGSPISLITGVLNVTFIPVGTGSQGIHTIRMEVQVDVNGESVTRATTVSAWNVSKE